MGCIIATVGISGSGKSTWAKAWVAESPETRYRSNRDEIRARLFDEVTYAPEQEEETTKVERQELFDAIVAGKDIVVDNTHLRQDVLDFLKEVADLAGYTFEAKPFVIDLATAKARVAQRVAEGGLHVEDSFIDGQIKRFEGLNL